MPCLLSYSWWPCFCSPLNTSQYCPADYFPVFSMRQKRNCVNSSFSTSTMILGIAQVVSGKIEIGIVNLKPTLSPTFGRFGEPATWPNKRWLNHQTILSWKSFWRREQKGHFSELRPGKPNSLSGSQPAERTMLNSSESLEGHDIWSWPCMDTLSQWLIWTVTGELGVQPWLDG